MTIGKDELSRRVADVIDEIQRELEEELSPGESALETKELKADLLEFASLIEELEDAMVKQGELLAEARTSVEREKLNEHQTDELEPEKLEPDELESDMLFDESAFNEFEKVALETFGSHNADAPEDPSVLQEKRAEVAGELDRLIANFDKSDVIRLYQNCDALVDKYGFTAFQNAFDDILADKDLLAKSRKSSLRELNRYLSDSMTATMQSLLLQGAQKQARDVLDLFNKPSATQINDAKQLLQNSSAAEAKNLIEQEQNSKIEAIMAGEGTEESKDRLIAEVQQDVFVQIAAIDLVAKALEMAEEDAYQEVRELARAGLKKEAKGAIDAIENSEATEEDKAAAVHIIELDLDGRLTAIDNRDMPIDYYIEKARFKNLTAEKIGAMTQLSADVTNRIQNYICQNLLSASSLDKRTVIMERNILMMEKSVQKGDLLTANAIFLVFQEASISRLELTQAGLSSHARQVLTDLQDNMFNLDKNSVNWRAYVAENESASLPPFLIAKDLQIWPEQPFKNLVNVGEHGELTTTLAQNCFNEISSCEKALAAGEALHSRSNPVLAAELQPLSAYEQLYTAKDYTLESMPENGELKERVLYISFDENKPENLKYTVKLANGELKEREISIDKDLMTVKYNPNSNQLFISQLQEKAGEVMSFAAKNKDIPPRSLEKHFIELSKQAESTVQQELLTPSSRVEKIREIIRPRPTVKEQLETSLERIEDKIEKTQLKMTKIEARIENYRENHPSLWSRISHKISSFFNSLRLDSVFENIRKDAVATFMEKNLRSKAISEETAVPAETRESRPQEENSRTAMLKKLFQEALNPPQNSGARTIEFKKQLPEARVKEPSSREEQSEENSDTNAPRNL